MFTLTFIANKIAQLLKCILCHTGDLGSRLDTLDDIETEKLSISPNCFIALKFISLDQFFVVTWVVKYAHGYHFSEPTLLI